MRVLLHTIISLVGTIAAGTFTGAKINLRRCADAKIQNHDVMAIVVVVSSIAHDFSQRSGLRQKDFRDAKLLSSRTVFRPMNSAAGAISNDDILPVCGFNRTNLSFERQIRITTVHLLLCIICILEIKFVYCICS